MASARVLTFDEGSNWYLPERVTLPNGAYAARADVTNIDLAVFDLDAASPQTAIYTATGISTNSIIPASLTVDGYWPYDTTGYNFLATVLATSVDVNGLHRVRVEYKLNTASYGAVYVPFIVLLEPVMSL